MSWYPHVTVATVIEHNDKFLFVEETCNKQRVFNQPAGHLEQNETLVEAAIRETLEETRWEVSIDSVLGISLYTAPSNQITYLRVLFAGSAIKEHPERDLDTGIENAVWLSWEEAHAKTEQMRSPLVLQALEEYKSKPHLSLDILSDYL